MPRNGDGSSDNGPFEGHEIVHGTDGDRTLQHTKHVAPLPEQEQGDALPGLGAGGVAAPIADNAEEFGTNEPRKDPLSVDADKRDVASPEPRPSNKRQKTADADISHGKESSQSKDASASASSTSQSHHHTSSHNGSSDDTNDLEQVSRQKAEKYVNLNEDEVNMAAASTEDGKRNARADRAADATGEATNKDKAESGDRADVEMLHGDSDRPNGDGQTGGNATGTAQTQHGETNELEQVQRHQAEKFGVNLHD
ncbi:hypothetical protein ACN47E_006685 [Coniothyrium glycines]